MSDGEKPSAESMREVKREYKQRRKAEEQRAKDAKAYWDQQTGKKPQKSGGRALAVVALVAATVGVAGAGAAVAKVGPFAASPASSNAAGATPSSAAPSRASQPTTASKAPTGSASPSTAADGTDPTLVAAFEGTPAASWKPGLAGIVMPKGKQVGIYRPRQVADAYDKLAVYLRHVMLDPRVQFQGKLDPVFATMSSHSVSWIKDQHALFVKTKGKKGYAYSGVAVRFRPGDWRAADATRVRGKTTTKVGPNGALELDFTYVAAYWLQPKAGGDPRAIAVRLEGVTYFYGKGSSKVDRLQAGFLGIMTSASACGSGWKYPDYAEAWTDMTKAQGGGTATAAGDMTDPDAKLPTGCIHDTSGF